MRWGESHQRSWAQLGRFATRGPPLSPGYNALEKCRPATGSLGCRLCSAFASSHTVRRLVCFKFFMLAFMLTFFFVLKIVAPGNRRFFVEK